MTMATENFSVYLSIDNQLIIEFSYWANSMLLSIHASITTWHDKLPLLLIDAVISPVGQALSPNPLEYKLSIS